MKKTKKIKLISLISAIPLVGTIPIVTYSCNSSSDSNGNDINQNDNISNRTNNDNSNNDGNIVETPDNPTDDDGDSGENNSSIVNANITTSKTQYNTNEIIHIESSVEYILGIDSNDIEYRWYTKDKYDTDWRLEDNQNSNSLLMTVKNPTSELKVKLLLV